MHRSTGQCNTKPCIPVLHFSIFPNAVHVEMDFFGPAGESVQNFWRNLPPPVQQAAPIVGTGLLTALIVSRIERSKLKAEVGCGACVHAYLDIPLVGMTVHIRRATFQHACKSFG